MGVETKRLYEFGPFRLDPVKRVLLKEGEPVPLTPKAFETLTALVQSTGDVLQKDDLMRRVWPDSFVEEGNLTVNISMLRKALGESPNQHRYIVTVPGRGYRFVESVRELLEEGDALVVEEHTRSRVIIEHESVEGRRDQLLRLLARVRAFSLSLWRSRWLVHTIGALILCLLASLLFWKQRVASSPPQQADWRSSLKFSRVAGLKSDRNESMNSGRLSPDGSLVVFCSAGEGLNLWIRQIGGGQPMQITRGPWHDDSPVWSANQQRIAFISDRDNQLGIWTVPSLGGEPPTQLKILESNAVTLKGGTAIKHWSKDGTTIYFSWKNNVHAVDVASKQIIQITSFDSEPLFSREFRISPDEQWIAYVDKKDRQYDIWRVPIRGGAPLQVTNDPAREHRPVWHPDGKRILYSARLDGRFRLYAAYLDNRPPELIEFTEDESYIWDVSSDGTKLLYYGKRDESDLWQISIDTKVETQHTSDIGLEFWPQVSPDGGSIAFQAIQGEKTVWDPLRSSLLVGATASSGQTIQVAPSAFEAQWSPDGETLAFMRESDGIINLFTIRAAGGEERQITTGGAIFGGSTIGPPFNRFCTRDFCWSPDGSRIAYCSKKDGAPNLWVVSADGSHETRISDNADQSISFNCPIWSPNGRRIAYVTNTSEQPAEGKQSWGLWLTDLERSEIVFNSELVLRLLGWSSSAGEVVIAMVENQGMNRAFPAEVSLSRVSIAGIERKDINHIESAYLASFHLSPDGRNISFVAAYNGRDNIWVLPVDGGEKRRITMNVDSKSYYSGLAWSQDGKQIYYGKQSSWSLITIIDNFK